MEQLIAENEGLCRKWAGRYSQGNRQHLHEDLMQEARLGLVHAIERVDLARGTALSTYATWWIRQRVSRYVQERESLIHVPVHVGEHIGDMRRAITDLEISGQEPTDAAVSAVTGLGVADVAALRRAMQPIISLSHTLETGGDELGDLIPAPAPDLPDDDPALVDALWDALCELTEREEQTIIMRFGLDGHDRMTLTQCSECLGVSRERVRQHEVMALRKLRAILHLREPALARRRAMEVMA